jgi:hypothetical protein
MNDGALIGLDFFKKSFLYKGVNYFETVNREMSKKIPSSFFSFTTPQMVYSERLEDTIIGEGCIVTKTKHGLFSFKFKYGFPDKSDPKKAQETLNFSKFHLIKHELITDYEGINFRKIAPTSHQDYFMLFYEIGDSENILIWDLHKNREYDSFNGRPNDRFMFYCNGISSDEVEKSDNKDDEEGQAVTYQYSRIGYLMCNNYFINLDNMIPSPFIQSANCELDTYYWNSGRRVTKDEKYVLSKGDLIASFSYMDLYLRSQISSEAPKTIQACKYFINRNSIITDNDENFEKLETILEIMKSEPIYFTSIVLPDQQDESPMNLALSRNTPKTVELYMKYISMLPEFRLSKSFYQKFENLFEMGVLSFKDYLSSCYFQTAQMKMINKMYIEAIDETQLEHSNSSMLGGKFIQHLEKKDKKKHTKSRKDKNSKDIKDFSFEESSTPDLSALIEEEESVLSVKLIDYEENIKENKKKDHSILSVKVRVIEFDWLLRTKQGENFLQQLAETSDLAYFDLDIVKHIINFQWKRYLPRIALFLFLPFLAFFIAFLLFATWIIHEMHVEDNKDGEWRAAAQIYAVILFTLQIFFVAIELNQMMRDFKGYISSFWNIIDCSSIAFNYALLIMVMAGSDPEMENAIAGIAVLLFWSRVFYLLRVFDSTAYLVSMITAIISDMVYFMYALIITMLAFGNAYFILGRNTEDDNFAGSDIWEAWIYSVRTGLGDFNTDGFGTSDEVLIWIIWFINTIIIVIILLNLVIAIMGDTFGRVQETQEATKLQEFANIMRENEFLISRKYLFKNIKYIIVVEPTRSDEQESDWQGRLLELKKRLNSSIEKNSTEFEEFKGRVKKMVSSQIKENFKPFEDKMNTNIENIDMKLSKQIENIEKQDPNTILANLKRINKRRLI